MVRGRRKWKWWVGAGILAACILLWGPLQHAAFSVRLALSLQKFASGADGRDLAVSQAKMYRTFGGHRHEALLYRPTNSPATKALILVAGLSELGCYHPRLVALSRFLANTGFLVLTPDIREFREFQISPEPLDQILFWYGQIPNMEGGEKVKTIGLSGISYSGTLALIAAAKPEIRGKLGFVAAIGPYANLIRCARNWFAASPAGEVTNVYPTRFYAKWIIMLSALDMIAGPEDRYFIQTVLHSLLLQKEVPLAGPDLTIQGMRWYRLATMRENQSDPELASDIEYHLGSRIYSKLDPGNALDKINCPVFLIHGAYDDLIPPEESIELHRKITDSHLLILPFLTHTHPTDTALSRKQKIKTGWESLVFCYQFSRTIHSAIIAESRE